MESQEETSYDECLTRVRDRRDVPKPLELMKEGKFLHVQAPMVRYSKLPFRMLCARWGCDVLYTPMIVAADFVRHREARLAEFSTNQYDRPMIVQFAAKKAEDLAQATEYVANYCEGIDINCGCPQKWVMSEGYGSALLTKPERVYDMLRQMKNRTNLPVSIKIRILPELSQSVELARRAEMLGASWVTVHGRTPRMRSTQPVNYEAVKVIKDSLSIPVIGNGNCFTLKDAHDWQEKTGVNGVMAARGLLMNPALFAGFDTTPVECITEFIDIALRTSLNPKLFHQHLLMMLYHMHSKVEKREFNSLKSVPAILDFLERRGLPFHSVDLEDPVPEMIKKRRIFDVSSANQ